MSRPADTRMVAKPETICYTRARVKHKKWAGRYETGSRVPDIAGTDA
jgi:hypothetical protein